ncbi:MAG: TRAP transporter large permease subunit, partial [Alphaproteobacteria bacterium]|nr:TRAP transporter large permease subunit [Alphaproteobacteria bacterium]
VAAPMAYVLISERMPQAVVAHVAAWATSPEAIMLAVVALGTVAGMFIDLTASMLIIVPLLFPLILAVGIDPVHFGLVLVVTLMMGGITPPVGVLVFIPAAITKTPTGQIFREVMPFVVVMFLAILVFALVPAIPLAGVRWFG